MSDTQYIHPDEEEVKAGPMPWTVERTVTTSERQAVTRLCDAIETLSEALAPSLSEEDWAERQRQVTEIVAEVRELVKPETTVIFDPSNPDAAAPSEV